MVGGRKSRELRGLDRWLESCEADPWTLSGILGLEELRKAAPRELKRIISLRKERNRPRLKELLKVEATRVANPEKASGAGGVDPSDPLGVLTSAGSLILPEGADRVECLLRPGYLDLFSGAGAVARELSRLSGRWVLSYDIVNSEDQDLLSSKVQREIFRTIEGKAFVGIGAAPVCASMSHAITPAWRTTSEPQGVQGLTCSQQAKVDAGNAFAQFVSSVGELCWKYTIPFWCENPGLSFLWWMPAMKQLASHPEFGFWLLDFCAFNTPWRKRTRILTNTVLKEQRTLCPGCERHRILRGRSRVRKKSWTNVAEPYPSGLASTIAMALTGSSGDRPEFKTLDGTACARCTHCRIGEAKAPGPRKTTATERARSRSGVRLADVELVEPKTAQLEAKLWEGFLEWLTEDCELQTVELLLAAAVTVAPLLRLYGGHLFRSGATLSSFRHLVAFASRKFLDFKFHSKVCWDFVTKWQNLEPLTHRLPLPWKLCQAMASLAVSWRWPRFALSLLIAFLGIREVLKACRRDLVLPSDLLSDNEDKKYLKVREPKSKRRGGGRVQHATITNRALVSACQRVFGGLASESLLFPYSNNTFRRRWDELLKTLGVGTEIPITPGRVRGGAAVHAYQSGVPLHDLLWRMRIQHIATLQHYLQEMAAESVLGQLSASSRASIRAASSLLPCVLDAL